MYMVILSKGDNLIIELIYLIIINNAKPSF